MLYFLGQLGEGLTAFNVFRYITFRTAGAVVTALFFVFLFGPGMIAGLRIRQGKGQPIREDGPQSHLLIKKGTPTMGGLMILAGAVISTLLWSNLSNVYVWAVLFVTISFGAIGFYDDYLKVKRMSHKGFSGWQRLAIEAVVALIAAYIMASVTDPKIATQLMFPFIKGHGAAALVFLLHLCRLHHRRRRQLCEFHGWPRRPRHRSGDGGCGDIRADRLSRRLVHLLGISVPQ